MHRVASGQPDTPSATASAKPTASVAKISTNPPTGAVAVAPDAPVSVQVDNGRLQTVTLAGPDGTPVTGQLGPMSDTWTSTGYLALATSYTFSVTAVDPAGLSTSATSTFTTMPAPADPERVRVSPLDSETVGVGMPVVLYFTHPVIDRVAVERRLSVTSTPAVVGGWYWMSDTELHYRPQAYWPAGASVTVNIPLNGVNAGAGIYGDQDRVINFKIADHAMVSTVDIAGHSMTVTRDGATVATYPITSGKPGWETRDGAMVVLEKWPDKEMNAATIDVPPGSPEYYDLLHVLYALRLTWSGEFVHAAPWSVGAQGSANVSHGCVGLSTDNAKAFFDMTTRGDIIDVVNSPRPLEQGNGYTDWNLSWPDWLRGSALYGPTAQQTATATITP